MESEAQKTTVSDATLSNPLKRKANHRDGTNCSSPRSKLRDRVSESDIPAELLTGKHMCIKCSQRIALTDEKGFTLAHWLAHLLVCNQSRLVYSADQGGGAESKNTQVSPQFILAENVARPSSASDTKTQMMPQVSGMYLNARKDAELFQKLRLNTRENASFDPHSAFDTINQAGSVPTKRRRPNRTEAERKEELLADPNVAEVEPYRILCAVCDKWIKLRKNSRYCSIPWNCHKDSCQKANSRPKNVTTASVPDSQTQHSGLKSTVPTVTYSSVLFSQSPNSSMSHPPLLASHPTDLMLPPASSHPSLKIYTSMPLNMSTKSGSMSPNVGSHPEPTRRALSIPHLTHAEQRRMALEADPHSEIVEHDRVLCSLCKRWVKLRQNSAYCAAPWRSHIVRCANRNERHQPSGSGSSDYTASLTREATAGSHAAMSIGQDLKSSYYRKNYNDTLHPAKFKGELKASYYKTPVTLSAAPQRKSRGRQLKVKALELRPDHPADTSESEVSYESEEA